MSYSENNLSLAESLRKCNLSHLVSADRSGTLGSIENAWLFWSAIFEGNFGLEVIAWRLIRLPHLLTQEKSLNAQHIYGIHGPGGKRDEQFSFQSANLQEWLIFNALNVQLLPTDQTLPLLIQKMKAYPEEVAYYLVHEQGLGHIKPFIQDLRQIPNLYIAIENDITKGSFQRALAAAKELEDLGVHATFVFDLVHLMRELCGPVFPQGWHTAWEQVEKEIANLTEVLLHVPIGERDGDSISKDMPQALLSVTGETAKRRGHFSVIECQPENKKKAVFGVDSEDLEARSFALRRAQQLYRAQFISQRPKHT